MTLYLIGLGLGDEKDITLRGLEIIKSCDYVYFETYTSLLSSSIEDLETLYGKKLISADRAMTEQGEEHIIELAKNHHVAFLVIGDPFSATTHTEFLKTAFNSGVTVQVVHNASVLGAIGRTGLQLYKFGKTTSIPFIEDVPHLEAPYHIIRENHLLGAHTLCLLDLKPGIGKFMTINSALTILKGIETRLGEGVITDSTPVVGCARLGRDDFMIRWGKLSEIINVDFGAPPHCLIIPGKLHFMEEETLTLWK